MAVPPQVPVVKFVSPARADQALLEFHNTSVAAYRPLDLGAVHENTREYPGYKLGKQFNLPNDEKWVIRIWVTDQTDPTWHNWAEKFSSDSNSHPIFIREYREPRKTYAPLTKGLPLKSVYRLTLATVGAGYTPGTLPELTFDNTATGGTGAAGHAVVSPDGTIAHLVLDDGGDSYASAPTFAIEAPPAGGTTATGTAVIQPATALLVAEEAQQFPADSEFFGLFLNVVRVYETLPGPLIPDNRDDLILGPVQRTRQAVLNTGQTSLANGPVATATTKTTYEGRDGSSVVLWKIVENWSDGTGSAGNPAYPLQTSTEFERDGVKKVVTRQLKTNANIVTTETLTPGVLTRKFGERYNEFLQFQIIETITVIDGDLLDLPSFTTSIPNLIPEIFRAEIPTHVESHIIEGTAEETVLALGEFEHTERQLTPLYKEVRSTILDDIGALPITVTGMKETNQNKQVVTVAMKLDVDSITPTTPTALIDVDFKKLGNGLAIEITKTIPSVFAATSSTVEIPDLIPPEFRANFPLTTTEVSSAGTAANPASLGTGDIRKTEAQIDAFVKRVTTASRGSITFPATLELHETTTEYGGGDLEILVTIDDAPLTIDEGLLIVDSQAKPLGGGLYLRITKQLDAAEWPVLESELYDEEMRVGYSRTEQVVDAGTAPDPTPSDGVIEEIKGLDVWRSQRIIITKTPTAIDYASAIVSEVRRPYKFPGRYDIFGGSAIGRRYMAPAADLVQILLRTWWEISATKPDISSLVSDIFPDTISVIESNPVGEGLRERNYEGVLHDAGYIPGSGIVPATTPTFTEYTGLGPITVLTGTVGYTSGSAVVTGTGTAFSSQVDAGDYFFGSIAVVSVGSNTSLTLATPIYFPPDASPISGLTAFIRPYDAGDRWIGTERIIGATVVPAPGHNRWRVELQSVVMR